MSIYALPKVRFQDYDQETMHLLSDLCFADSTEEWGKTFPKVEGFGSWRTLRSLLAKYATE